MREYMTVQTRVDAHNTELDAHDDILRDARAGLVSRTGALVAGGEGDGDDGGDDSGDNESGDKEGLDGVNGS